MSDALWNWTRRHVQNDLYSSDEEKVNLAGTLYGIMDQHWPVWKQVMVPSDEGQTSERRLVCNNCVREGDPYPGQNCQTIQIIGGAYRDRDGYREEWKRSIWR